MDDLWLTTPDKFGIVGSKRKFGYTGSLTITNRRDNQGNMYTSEHTRIRHRRGRKPRKTLKNLYKLTRSVTEPIVLRWQNLNQYMTTGAGAIKLMASKTTASAQFPIHMYDITSFINNNGGIIQTSNPGYELRYLNTVKPAWVNVQRADNGTGNVDSSSWIVENTSSINGSIAQMPHRSSIFDWFEYRMLCYGRTELPTRYSVAIVKLHEDYLHPAEQTVDGPDDSTADPQREFWNSLLTPFCENPISAANVAARKGKIKFLYQDDFLLHSPSSQDGTAAGIPNVKEVRGFHRFNRVQHYDWKSPVGENIYLNPGLGAQALNKWQATEAVNSAICKPGERLYLMVRGQAQWVGTTASAGPNAWDVRYHPSYDLMMRVRHTVSDG